MVACVAAIWLVACGVLGARHQARAAHFIDAHGQAFHGSHMSGEHTTNQSDIHARDSAPDHDVCTIAASLQPTVIESVGVSASVSASDPDPLTLTPALTPTRIDLLRVAPKTSPPTHA